MLELKHSVDNNVIDQWQPRLKHAFVSAESTLNSCLIEIFLFVVDGSHVLISLHFKHN